MEIYGILIQLQRYSTKIDAIAWSILEFPKCDAIVPELTLYHKGYGNTFPEAML